MRTHQDPLKNRVSDGVKGRRTVDNLVLVDVAEAYLVAKAINHPWYRCQALSAVAEHVSDSSIGKILKESFDTGKKCHDENGRVSVLCWPLRVALERDIKPVVEAIITYISEQISYDSDPISKWCAVSVLRVIKADEGLLKLYFPVFEAATSQGHGRRIERYIKDMLSDPYIQKDKRYIEHLVARQSAIIQWRVEHGKVSVNKSHHSQP